MRKWIVSAILIIIGLYSCQNQTQKLSEFEQGAKMIQERFIPDKSLAAFRAELSFENGMWLLDGESDVSEYAAAVVSLADSLIGKNQYKNNFSILPEESLGDSIYAITSVSVANIRRDPRHSAEMVDQSIMGRPLKLLKYVRGGWYMIQTHYGYIGYIQRGQLTRMDKKSLDEWQNAPAIRMTALSGQIFSKPDEESEPVSDFVINVQLKKTGSTKDWIQVELPRGKQGYVEKEDAVDASADQKLTLGRIMHTAHSMMGVPYLWGGNSSKGNDCSGFTQTVFNANGVQLPRDARQQVLVGEEIIPNDDFSNIRPGDLLFFGSEKRITHVGISIGGDEFIHQAGYVHISSLNPEKENYSAYRKGQFQKAKRVIHAEN
ncbi:MAG: C40 family peptidase [Calditrichaeota bacterium]|nr:C40 family peptidase [Calditrichota bacterium]